MSDIRLNFLPLESQDFSFVVYRQVNDITIEREPNTKYYFIRTEKHSEERKSYQVSLFLRDGFQRYTCDLFENISLTKWYLFQKLIDTIKVNTTSIQYTLFQKNKIDEIHFRIGEFIEGEQHIILSPYFLSNGKKFGFLIDFKFKKKPGFPFNKEVQRLSLSLDEKYRSNKNYYLDKYRLIQSFLSKEFTLFNSFKVDGLDVKIQNSLLPIPCFLLEKKQYIFYDNKLSNSQFLGIKNFGPLESINEDVKFVFIFEDKFKSFANDVFLSLKGKLNPGTFLGMDSMFKIKLNTSNVDRISITDYSEDELIRVVDQIAKIPKSQKIIAIFIEDYSEENGNSKPYYFLKYHFLKNDIPLQVINYQRLSVLNTLKWSTSNIGLQIFSKLGGKPWIVKPSKSNCLILGIGSSHKFDEETGKIKKFFAYSICLDSSGLYKKLEVLADTNSEKGYLEEFEKNLKLLLRSSDFSNYTSCVLHLPFKIKGSEIDALEKVISEISSMVFTVVKINVDNKYFGFSSHNTLVPYESSYVELSKNQFLVWFEGLNFGKENVDKQISNPVHIEFLNIGNRINDYKPYLQDIINLSGANWRGFNAKSVPISIYYSKIITEYISEFGQIGIDKIYVSNNKPWFL